MSHHRATKPPKQSGNSVRGVKHVADAVGVTPHTVRKWLRRKYGRRRRGDWQWLFTEREAERIVSEYRGGGDAV